MNVKVSFVLACLFILLGSFAIFDPLKLKDKKQEQTERNSSVFWLKDKKISKIEIIQKNDSISAECVLAEGCPLDVQGKWRLRSPIQEEGDDNNIGMLLSSLSTLSVLDRLDFKGEELNLNEFSLEKPSHELRFSLKDSKEEFIKIGAKASVGSNVYALASGRSDQVILIPSHFSDALRKELFHWRNKRIFPALQTEQIATLSWEFANTKIVASQKNGIWRIQEPLSVLADASNLNSLAGGIAFLSATQIFEKTSKEIKNLAKPVLKVFVQQDSLKSKVEFFKSKDGIFVKSDARPWIAKVDTEVVDRLQKSVNYFRNRQILGEDMRTKIASLEFVFPRQKKKAIFKKGENNQWVQVGGDPIIQFSVERLRRFIDALSSNDVVDFEHGMEKAKLLHGLLDLKLRILDGSEKVLAELPFVVVKKQMAYTTGELPNEVRVIIGGFLKELPVRLENFSIESNKSVVVQEHPSNPKKGVAVEHTH